MSFPVAEEAIEKTTEEVEDIVDPWNVASGSNKGVDYKSLESLLDSVKAKKIKRVNYHQQKIVDVIEKAIK